MKNKLTISVIGFITIPFLLMAGASAFNDNPVADNARYLKEAEQYDHLVDEKRCKARKSAIEAYAEGDWKPDKTARSVADEFNGIIYRYEIHCNPSRPKKSKVLGENIQQNLSTFSSPIPSSVVVENCKKDEQACRMMFAICYAESKFGTDYYKPDVEKGYFNCSGWKSPEILATHKADSNGSWLMKFNSWEHHFTHTTDRLRKGYLDKGCTTAECIGQYYVGSGASARWIETVNQVLNSL